MRMSSTILSSVQPPLLPSRQKIVAEEGYHFTHFGLLQPNSSCLNYDIILDMELRAHSYICISYLYHGSLSQNTEGCSSPLLICKGQDCFLEPILESLGQQEQTQNPLKSLMKVRDIRKSERNRKIKS